MKSLTIYFTNSSFSQLDHTALTIINRCHGYNKVHIENCTFESNYMVPHNEENNVMLKPLIDVLVAHDFKLISFKRCKFTKNHHASTFISIVIRTSTKCHGKRQLGIIKATNISFVACQFIGNVVSEMINTKALKLYN